MSHEFAVFPWSDLLSINRRRCSFNIVYGPNYEITSQITMSIRSSGEVSRTDIPFTREDRDMLYDKDRNDFPFGWPNGPSSRNIQKLKDARRRIPVSFWSYYSSQNELNNSRFKYLSDERYAVNANVYRSPWNEKHRHNYINIKDFSELPSNLKGEYRSYFYKKSEYTLTIWNSCAYIISTFDKDGDNCKILATHVDNSYALQEGDHHTHVWLVNKESFVVYNDGDVFSVVVITKNGG